MRYSPLGSPWLSSKRLLVHTVDVWCTVVTCVCGGAGGGYRGWVGRGSTQPVPSQASPEADWYCQGPTNALNSVICVHHGTPGLSKALRTPWLLALSIPPSRTNMTRFHHEYPKVSHILGVSPKYVHEACHAPCFKNWSIIHDLKFSDFRFG